MKTRTLLIVALTLISACVSVRAAESLVPKPYVVAPECTDAQRDSAVAVTKVSEPVIACYFLQKWSYKGAALAVVPTHYAEVDISESDFYQLRKRVFREQSARLRMERGIDEALPDEPPPHGGLPLSLFVHTRMPLGVFLNESKHIGFADLVPTSQYGALAVSRQYPLIQLETFVHVQGRVVKLIQVSPISGPSTIGEGFRMADDWARRLNGGERLATED